MNKKIFFLGCVMLCLSWVKAMANEPMMTTEFPPMRPAMTDKAPQCTAAADFPEVGALNTEKNLGVNMYAYTLQDYFNDPGMVQFYSKSPNKLTKKGVFTPKEDDPYRMDHMVGGAYHQGTYYGYMTVMYTTTTYVTDFAAVDFENGTWSSVADLSAKKDNWDFMEAMASNPASGKLMGLARSRTGSVSSTIGEIDVTTGEYTILESLPQYYFSMAYDYDGVLYAVRWMSDQEGKVIGSCLVTLDAANHFKETVVSELVMNGKPYQMYYQNSLSFDYTTGDIWCLACDIEGRQCLAKIDPKSGTMTNQGGFGYTELGCGLYIPYVTAEARDAAFRVSDLTSEFGKDGASVVLKWTNPTRTWNGEELTELAEVKIFRDDVEVGSVKGDNKVGEPMQWADETAEKGVHHYKVVPCRRAGELGIPEYWDAFAGRDIPAQVTDLAIVADGNKITLNWNAPTIGENDGWYDTTSLKYKVTRYPDKVVVAEAQTENSFSETINAPLDYYSYGVVAFTVDGDGFELVSDGVLVGAPFTMPYVTRFEDEQEANRWTVWDANRDGNSFHYINWNEEMRGMQLETTTNPADDSMISPDLQMKANKTYRIVFDVFFQNNWDEEYYPNHMHNLAISAGVGAEGQKDIATFKDVKTLQGYMTVPFETSFTPEKDGAYNVGLRILSSVNDYLVLRAAKVEEIFATDLQAVSLNGTPEVAVGAASEFKVRIANKGSEKVDKFNVKIVRLDGGDQVVLGEKAFEQAIPSNESVEVALEAVPDQEGELFLAAVVELEGDENPDNNLTPEFVVNAAPEGTVPFNHVVIGDLEGMNTKIPFGFTRTHTLSQSVYLAPEIGLTEDVVVSRLAYVYNGQEIMNEEFDVEIYMATTDKSEVVNSSDWVKTEDMTLVFSGKKMIEQGDDKLMSFNLTESFKLPAGKNLLVAVRKTGFGKKGFSPAVFHQYNNDWEGAMRTWLYEGTQDFDFVSDTGCKVFPLVPVLHMAIEKKGVGIEEIVLDGKVWFDSDNRSIVLNGVDAASVEIYDFMGRLVRMEKVAKGVQEVNVNLAAGMYIVKVQDNNGSVCTTKIRVL